MADCWIAGLGLVTPLGLTVAQVWDALLAGEHICDHRPVRDGGEEGKRSRVCRLGLMAAREAVAQAGWDRPVFTDVATAVVVGTSKGAVAEWLKGGSGVQGSPFSAAGSAWPVGMHDVAGAVGDELGIGGPRLTVSAACASGLGALIRAAVMLRCGEARRVLVVAAEASLHPMFIRSFARLGVLAAEGAGCRPFDRQRSGFVMSEAAAAVCLDSDESCPAVARVDRFAMGGDAAHLTGGDPDGRLLRHLLHEVIGDRPVDLVHAHGTGTIFNDPVELSAIESAVSGRGFDVPALYSHKGAIGHCLGAAGLVSVVLNCRAHQQGIVPPNVQTRHPLDMTQVRLNGEIRHRPVRRSVAIAAGFGGATAAVSLY